MTWSQFKGSGRNAHGATTEFFVERHLSLKNEKMESLFNRLAKIQNAFGREAGEKSVRRFIEHRHFIMHRATEIISKFGESVGPKQALGTKLELTTAFLMGGLDELSSFAGGLQESLEAEAEWWRVSACPEKSSVLIYWDSVRSRNEMRVT